MLSLSPDVVGRQLDDRVVVVNLRTNRIYELNPTASALWELLDRGANNGELEAGMLARFDVPPEHLQAEIDKTLRTLTDAGLVSVQ